MLDLTGLLFETAPEGGGDGGAPPEAPAPPPEAPPESAPEAGAGEEAWTGPGREDWERVTGTLEGLEPLVNAINDPLAGAGGFEPGVEEPAAAGPAELQPPDPFSENYAAEMASFLEARDQRLMEQLRPVTDEVFMGRAEQTLNGALESLPQELRDLGLGPDHAEQAQQAITNLTSTFLPPEIDQIAAQRPDLLPVVLQRSVQQAGEYLRDLISLGKEQGRAEYKASLQGEGERQPDEPAIGGSGIEGVKPARSYSEIVERGIAGLST